MVRLRSTALLALATLGCLSSAACTRHRPELATKLDTLLPASAAFVARRAAALAPDPLPALSPDAHTVPIARADDGTGGRVVLGTLGGVTLAFVADEDDRAVHVVDVAEQKDLGRVPLGSRPSQVALTKDGKLLVALRDANAIAVLEAPADSASASAPLVTTSRLSVGTEPMALSVTPDDGTIVVADGWGHAVEAFDRQMGERTLSVDVAREPRTVLISADGAKAYVGHDAAGVLTVVDLASGKASTTTLDRPAGDYEIDDCGGPDGRYRQGPFPMRAARHVQALGRIPADPGKHMAWDVAGHERIMVPAARVASGPLASVTRGYGEDATVLFDADIVDTRNDAIMDTSGMAPLDRRGERPAECLLPSATVYEPKSKTFFIACMGNDTVLRYGVGFSTLLDDTRQFRVGRGPVGIARDPKSGALVVLSSLDRALTVIPLEAVAPAREPAPPMTIPLAPTSGPVVDAAVARGRSLFYTTGDRRIARDGRGCASCHLDGRDDSLVWSSPDGPRRTRLLAGRVAEGPYGWRGEHATLEEHVAASVARLGGTGLPAEDLAALAAYVRSIPAPPHAAEGEGGAGDPRVARGDAVFHAPESGCAGCHDPAHDLADGELHDVLSKAKGDRFGDFRTPSLLASAGSAPYFHDGRYASLRDVLGHTDGRMGNTTGLSSEDKDALVAYLQTL